MKKTYIIPQVEIHAVSVEGLIAASPTPQVGISRNAQDAVDAGSVDVKGNSQNYDVWDDDWNK